MGDYQPVTRRGGRPLLRGLVALVVVFALYGLIVGGNSSDEPPTPVVSTPTDFPTLDFPTATPPEPTTATPEPTTATPAPTDDVLLTPTPNGITVQVLNGSDEQRTASAVEALEQLGYEVAITDDAARQYTETTVFATAGHEQEAQDLADADPRFTVLEDSPGTLTAEVDVHVVVGQDWPLEDPAASGATVPPPPEPTATAT